MFGLTAATLDAALSGKDLLVQAKTGTGTSVLYILHDQSITFSKERHSLSFCQQSNASSSQAIRQRVPQFSFCHQLANLRSKSVISHLLKSNFAYTSQIEKEAESLLAHHPFKVQHAIGGTKSVFFY